MSRFPFIAVVAVALFGCSIDASAQETPPNIVLLLADDLGITDINGYASHFTGKSSDELFYETPNLDRLMRKGISFSQAYANQLCSPTRCAILTGQFPSRHGFTTATPPVPTYYNQGETPPPGYRPHDCLVHKDRIAQQQAWLNGATNTGLSASLPTLAKVLKTHHAAFLGKWHVGGHGALGVAPADHGFEPLAWYDAGASPYFNWTRPWDAYMPGLMKIDASMIDGGDAGPAPHAEYLTDDLTDRAVQFIERKHDQPYFLYFCHFAVHAPFQAPDATIATFEDKPTKGVIGHENATYAAMVMHLDDSVGRIMAAVEASGQADDTIIVFTSDNGGVEYSNPPATDCQPFKGGKACLYEGGVRVPLIVHQPGRFEGGQWRDAPVNCVDFLPTLAELTGNTAPEGLDGRSFVKHLVDPNAPVDERAFIWHYPFNVIVKHPDNGMPLTPHSAIRVGDFKLIWDWHGKLELYDIVQDPFETHDLSAEMPERTDRLFTQLREWLEANVDPQYFPRGNPDYDADQDPRPYPFRDLRER